MTLIGDRCNSTHILFFPSGLRKKAEQRAKYPGVLNKDYLSRKMVNSRQQKFVFCRWLVSWILIPQSSRKISFPGLYRFVFFFQSQKLGQTYCWSSMGQCDVWRKFKLYQRRKLCEEIWLALFLLYYVLRSLRIPITNLNQSEAKEILVLILSPTFSRALEKLLVLTLVSHWFPVIISFFSDGLL